MGSNFIGNQYNYSTWLVSASEFVILLISSSTSIDGSDILQLLDPVKMDASKRKGCLDNTRVTIQQRIIDWVDDRASRKRILWIYGVAGCGKSELSTTIARFFGDPDKGQLGAFIFFDRDFTERSDPAIVVRTLAYQLASYHPSIGLVIRAAIQNNPNISLSPLSRQFERLILDPISAVDLRSKHIIIIIDALDECGTPDERGDFLDVLVEQFAHLPSEIRCIVTSRAETDIRDALTCQRHIFALEFDITLESNTKDILSFLRIRTEEYRKKRSNRSLKLRSDWPGEDVLSELVDQASGLFVWAFIALKFIQSHSPQKNLDIILRRQVAPSAEGALDTLYRTALENSGHWDDEDFVKDFRAAMGAILVAREPLTVTAIDNILNSQEERAPSHAIMSLSCVLQTRPLVRVLHPSFSEFLLDKKRCKREEWHFVASAHHRSLALQCLDRMDVKLKQNVCDLTISKPWNDDALTKDLSYSCRFWVDHICVIKEDYPQLVNRLHDVLTRHLLHWLEAMSILRRSRGVSSSLDRLSRWLSVSINHCYVVNPVLYLIHLYKAHSSDRSKLYRLVREAARFAGVFADTIREHPLLVYSAALPFAPTNTSLCTIFHAGTRHQPSVVGSFRESWPPLLCVLAEYNQPITSLALSPQGTYVVFGLGDSTLRICDTTSGGETVSPIRGHEDSVISLSYSPDGTRIVSGSDDKTIRVWDASSGCDFLALLRGHQASVKSVVFSPNGNRIASGSYDGTIRLWDAKSGAVMTTLQLGFSITSLFYSMDGAQIVSGSLNREVNIWDAMSGTNVLKLDGHEEWVMSVAFSPVANRVVSGSREIRSWDATSGAVILPPMLGHRQKISSIIFSPDGKRLFSGSQDKTIRVWDAYSGTEVRTPLRGHRGSVCTLAAFPDGYRVISGSSDRTLRIWDVAADNSNAPQITWGHRSSVSSIAFSRDGTRVATGSKDRTIRVWDVISGLQTFTTMLGHEGDVMSVAFSTDGMRIVSGSEDKTIRIWPISNADVVTSLHGHEYGIQAVAFSFDSSRVVSGSRDKTVRLWDPRTSTEVHKFLGHTESIYCVTIAHDNRIIASASPDRTVRIWDANSGGAVAVFALHGRSPHSLAFSEDSALVFSSCNMSKSAEVWEISSSARVAPADQPHTPFGTILPTHDGWIFNLATNKIISKLPTVIRTECFTSHGAYLAVGTSDGQVLILNFSSIL